MAFYGNSFVFDNISSDQFNLVISSPDGGSVDVNASSNVAIIKEELPRRAVPYTYGMQQSPTLSFDIAINTLDNEIDAYQSSIIQSWLSGNINYKNLQINQGDMLNVTFRAIFNNFRVHKVGNKIVGYKATVECDAPWGWGFPYSQTFTPVGFESNIVIYNDSNNNDYTYPNLVINFEAPGSLTLYNLSDNFRVTSVLGILGAEIVTLDNDRKIITSSTLENRLSNFNKLWFRLKPGNNEITVEADGVYDYTISYTPAMKVGT